MATINPMNLLTWMQETYDLVLDLASPNNFSLLTNEAGDNLLDPFILYVEKDNVKIAVVRYIPERGNFHVYNVQFDPHVQTIQRKVFYWLRSRGFSPTGWKVQ